MQSADMASFFDPIIEMIITLIESQLDEVKSKHAKTKVGVGGLVSTHLPS